MQPWVGISIDVLGHDVIHKRVVSVSDDTPGVSNLSNIASPVTTVRPSPMPSLVVEHDDTSGLPQVVVDLVFPRRSLQTGGRFSAE